MAKKINGNINLLEEIKSLGEELAGCISAGIDADVLTDNSGRYKLACIILESFPHAVCVKDAQGRFLVCNSAMLSLMNVNDPRNLIGRTEFDFKSSSEAQIWYDTEQKAIKTLQPCIDSHLPVTDSKGNQKLYLVTIVPITDASENVSAIMEVSYEATEQIQTVKNLEESEKRYRTLFEGAAEGILVAEAETGMFIYVNQAICKMLGYSESELNTMGVRDVHPKEHLDRVLAGFRARASGETNLGVDIPCLCKDGSVKYVYINSTATVFDSRKCVVGFFTDVTELRKTQNELDKIQKHLQIILDNSFDGINICEFSHDLKKRRLVFCNNRYAEMSGLSREELMAAGNLNDFVADTASEETRRSWYECIINRIPFKGQTSWLRPDGKENYYEWAAAPIVIDGRYYVVGIDRDITDQIENHKQLKEAEARYRTLVERLPAILYVAALDEASTTLFISPQVQNVLGISPQQYKENPDIWRQRLHLEDKERVMHELSEANTGGKPFCCEYRMFNSAGEIVWFRDEASIVKDDSGKPMFLQGVMLDISDRKKVEHELEQIKKDLETRILQRTRDLENLTMHLRSLAGELSLAEERTRRRIAAVVHDSIGQNLGLTRIKLQAMINAPQAEPIREELKNISNLVAQMIDSARSLTFEISPPVLYELGFDAAVEWLLRQSRDRDELKTDFDSDGQSKKLEENLKVFLFQAVRELLINVTKHAKASHVDVSIKRVKKDICVCITDDGKGFDVEKKSSQAQNMSAGFGLFSIRERIRLLNGSLVIQSKPGYGTKVMLTVPLMHKSFKKRVKK